MKGLEEVEIKWGKDQVAVVFHAQMAGHAAEALVGCPIADVKYAAAVMAEAFNAVADALIKRLHLTPEKLGEIERDIQLAWHERVVAAKRVEILGNSDGPDTVQ